MNFEDLQEIYRTFQPRIFRYLNGMVGKNNAEDLTQVVFEKVSRGLTDFRGESSLATWIYRIATNVAVDHNRFASVRQGMVSLEDTTDSTCEWNALNKKNSDNAEHTIMKREMNACIYRIIKQMPERERVVLVLSEFEGMKNREIADILELSIDAVKIRLHRARKRLKKDIEAECILSRDERNELVCHPK